MFGHAANVTVAKISPSGYYCAAGDVAGNLKGSHWSTHFRESSPSPDLHRASSSLGHHRLGDHQAREQANLPHQRHRVGCGITTAHLRR